MLDFMIPLVENTKTGVEISPSFILIEGNDLMIRGRDFYAIWDEEAGMWSTNEQTAIRLMDKELDKCAQKYRDDGVHVRVKYVRMARTKKINEFHDYCHSQMRDWYHDLDEKLIFTNTEVKKSDYASKRLPYPLEEGLTESWDTLMGVLYAPEELKKIEWTIGAIINGDSKKIQKFAVFYGAPKTGKSTVIHIIEDLFKGYTCVFDSKALGQASNSFPLEAFRDDPLVAIQHDGDLSKIEDNTRLNSLVSHEVMLTNIKHKSAYPMKFKAFLYLGTNKPVRITDNKSGLLRRLIDITPTGNTVETSEYRQLMEQIKFEHGAIAYKCKKFYEKHKHLYDDYVPLNMMSATNDFYAFVTSDEAYTFYTLECVTARTAYDIYSLWCDKYNVFKMKYTSFKEELKGYFNEYKERDRLSDGSQVRCRYIGFNPDCIDKSVQKVSVKSNDWLKLKKQESRLDILLKEEPAQYATKEGVPMYKWDNVFTTLKDISTSKLHYVKPPLEYIVIDFDLKDENGEKSLEKNIEAALIFPPTYAEVSKSGNGLHLHYIYAGDASKLDPVYSDGIEIKVFNGGSSLRRKLTLCNDLDISTIDTGLPLKKESRKNVVNFDQIKSEDELRQTVIKNLFKKIVPSTSQSISLINSDLNKAYESGMKYDITDMQNAVMAFAGQSTNHASECLRLVAKMKFKSKDDESGDISTPSPEAPIAFFDVECVPNHFGVCYKLQGEDKPVIQMKAPKPEDIDMLFGLRLVGFNNLKYDNHMVYGRHLGYTDEQLYKMNCGIISGQKDAGIWSSREVSYTDILDFCSKKRSLKKWEIELSKDNPSLRHLENAIPWDKPVSDEEWDQIMNYCANDVIATEAVWNANQDDFIGREILADLAGMTVNDTTNRLTTRFIFGTNKNPQSEFNYRFMGDMSDDSLYTIPTLDCDWEYTRFDSKGRPIFMGYTFEYDKQKKRYVSMYRGEEVGEGGYVYAEPGIYHNVKTFDVASMHPSSIIAEKLFGDRYTQRFEEIVNLRVAVKHKDFEKARKLLAGAIAKYLKDEKSAKKLAYALKIAINSVYGLTAAKFDNAFRDKRNIDNIVAKRGALFMVNLKHEVQNRGFRVVHIKTDSIKVENPTPELEQFILDYGKLYGYNFEIEDEYERICLVNDAVYIARHYDGTWTATGKQFAVPYVFKTLFSKEPIDFYDMCETFSVETCMYLDFDEDLIDGDHNYVFVGRVGQFSPVCEGCNGGRLVRVDKDKTKYDAVANTKGYRWLESEYIRHNNMQDIIDISYYQVLVDKALATIEKFGNAQEFITA